MYKVDVIIIIIVNYLLESLKLMLLSFS